LLDRIRILERIFNTEYANEVTLEVALEESEIDLAMSFATNKEEELIITEIGVRMLKIIEDHCS